MRYLRIVSCCNIVVSCLPCLLDCQLLPVATCKAGQVLRLPRCIIEFVNLSRHWCGDPERGADN